MKRRNFLANTTAAIMLSGKAKAQTNFVVPKPLRTLAYRDENLGFVMYIPSDADVTVRPAPNQTLSGLMSAGERLMEIRWQGRVMHIDVAPVGFDFYHVDWLTAHAELSGVELLGVNSFENELGLPVGEALIAPNSGRDGGVSVYYVVIGKMGYFFSGRTADDNELTSFMIETIESNLETPWGGLTAKKFMEQGRLSVPVHGSFQISKTVDSDVKATYAHDADTLMESRFILAIRETDGFTPQESIATFNRVVSDLQLISRPVSATRESLTVDLVNRDQTRFSGYVYARQNGYSVSLICLAHQQNPSIWLSSRYFYVTGARLLEQL